MLAQKTNYCFHCGTELTRAVRYGKLRLVCPGCGYIHFDDPKVAVAVLIEEDGNVLLTRRKNDPARRLWTLPAGFIDAGEDPREAAIRECAEETGLNIKITGLVDVLAGKEHPRGAHILICFRGEIVSGQLQPGDDVDRVAFYSRQDLPPLAFRSTRKLIFS